MIAYVAESAASAPPPRKGPPLIPTGRASALASGIVRGATRPVPGSGEAGEADDAIAAFQPDASGDATDGPPLEDLEAQMGGEVAERDASTAPRTVRARAATVDDEDEGEGGGKGAPLPELDELLGRLPAEVREAAEELLRVRYVSVKKLPKKAFGGDDTRSGAPA